MNMLVFTAKLTRRKVILGVMTFGFLICGLFLGFSSISRSELVNGEVITTGKEIMTQRLKTAEDRIVLLESLGWEVQKDPIEFREVYIPEEFDAIYLEYNEIQKEQGFDLSKYAGKHVMKYSYTVTNHPAEEDVIATILVYKSKLIGGDVTSAKADGFLQGLIKKE